jgi:hypothetical protein
LEHFRSFRKRGGEFEFEFQFQSGTEIRYELNLGLKFLFELILRVSEAFKK